MNRRASYPGATDRTAHEAGRLAGLRNDAASANPYHLPRSRQDWVDGWRQGQVERQKAAKSPAEVNP